MKTLECEGKLLIWLLITHISILMIKVFLTILFKLNEDHEDLNTIGKIVAVFFYIFFYPFLIVWNVLGTLWLFELHYEKNINCVDLILSEMKSMQQYYWMALIWIFISYFLTIIYLITSISVLTNHCKQNERTYSDLTLNYSNTDILSIYVLS